MGRFTSHQNQISKIKRIETLRMNRRRREKEVTQAVNNLRKGENALRRAIAAVNHDYQSMYVSPWLEPRLYNCEYKSSSNDVYHAELTDSIDLSLVKVEESDDVKNEDYHTCCKEDCDEGYSIEVLPHFDLDKIPPSDLITSVPATIPLQHDTQQDKELSPQHKDSVTIQKPKSKDIHVGKTPSNGRQVVDLKYAVQWALELQCDHIKVCPLGKLKVLSESKTGLDLVYELILKCDTCDYKSNH